MKQLFFECPVLWSQIDANGHLRHSAYADFAAQARVEVLALLGITATMMEQADLGPILFREEARYLREVRAGDRVRVNCLLSKCRADGSRWSFYQEIVRQDGVRAANVLVDGGWMSRTQRRLVAPPAHFVQLMLEQLSRTDDFALEPVKE
jgi:acyl-CoA thioester hydrolase